MNLLKQHFDVAFAAPDGIKKLRELILTLAMQGKLVPQDLNDEPASELLRSIELEKKRLVKEGRIKQPKILPDIDLEELPHDLPNNWEWVRLGEIIIFTNGFAFKSNLFQANGVGIIKIGDISNGEISKNKMDFIDPIYLEEVDNKFQVYFNDLLIAMSGATTGKLGFNKTKEVFLMNQRVGKIEPIIADKAYLYNFLSTQIQKNLAISSGSAIPNLSTEQINGTIIPLPPLAEQRRIVAKIDQLMARCNELEKLRIDRSQRLLTVHTAAIDRLLTAKDSSEFSTAWSFITQHFGELYSVKENVTELRKTILQLAVMGKLVRQDPNDEPASELLRSIELEKQRLVNEGKIKSQKLLPEISSEEIPYTLPKSWEWVRTDDLCIGITSGSTPPNHIFSDTEGIPFLKVYNIRNQKIDFRYKSQFITEEYHEKGKRSCLKPGDVLMNIVGPPLGKVAIIPDDFPEYNCNQAIVFFRPVVKSMNEYIYLYLLAGKFLDNIDLIGTAGQDNISVTKSRSILIPLPPLAEQRRIVEKIDRLMGMCDRLEGSIESGKGKQTDLLNALMSQV
jgi:type I restriction enzyme, S subunit